MASTVARISKKVRTIRLGYCKNCGVDFRYTAECFHRCEHGKIIAEAQRCIDEIEAGEPR